MKHVSISTLYDIISFINVSPDTHLIYLFQLYVTFSAFEPFGYFVYAVWLCKQYCITYNIFFFGQGMVIV